MKITGLFILFLSFILTCFTFYSCDNNNISEKAGKLARNIIRNWPE